MAISIIGLGKLGLPLACVHALHGPVRGVDVSDETVRLVNLGISPIEEPDLESLLKQVVNSGNLTAHTDMSVVAETDLSMIIVPTPSDKDGSFTSKYVIAAVKGIGKAIRDREERHTIVVCSTVMPGECVGPITDALEGASGKTVGQDVGLVYSPEFIALGSVIHDLQNPDFILVGESDTAAGDAYAAIAREACHHTAADFRMSLTSAEIAKIALNSYVTMKISFANNLSELCERHPGANAFDITNAIGLDPRVGRKYFQPGGPFGGPCFPRDNRAYARASKNVGMSFLLPIATDEVNDHQIDRMVKHVQSFGRSRVGILGLTYKPGAPVLEESFGVRLAERFAASNLEVRCYDSLVTPRPGVLPKSVTWSSDPGQCFGSDTVTVLALPDPDLIKLMPQVFAAEHRYQSIVIDCWNCLPEGPWDNTHIVRPGVNNAA